MLLFREFEVSLVVQDKPQMPSRLHSEQHHTATDSSTEPREQTVSSCFSLIPISRHKDVLLKLFEGWDT